MLNNPVSLVKGVGEKRLSQLQRLGIETVGDLMAHLPRDYHDLTKLSAVSEMQEGERWFGKLTLLGNAQQNYARRSLCITKVKAGDESGSARLVFYNQPFLKNALPQGRELFVYGTPQRDGSGFSLAAPMIEGVEQGEGLRMLPLYRTTTGLSQGVMRKLIKQAFTQFGDGIDEVLPRRLREQYRLFAARDALQFAHFPPSAEVCAQAVRTLGFQELLLLRLFLQRSRQQRGQAPQLKADDAARERFLAALGFAPTTAQTRAMQVLEQDMAAALPMSRLLQGDVGSGKTAVAFYALYLAAINGKQGGMMAPTELLAQQHYRSAQALFEPLGMSVGLLRAGMKAAERRQVLEDLQAHRIDLVFGTHALLGESVHYADLGALVVDEQHRFGVRQRASLLKKEGGAHALFLSATPIPRTLSLIVYGDLDVSVLDELPPHRQPIKTLLVPPEKQGGMIDFLAKTVAEGRQAYYVCPLIEAQEEGERHSAQQTYEELKEDKRLRAALLHGRMKQKERDEVMQAFVAGDVGVLISTTVIEVGVDVKNATVMVVQEADRFGLAQLHQLRGRVGRGSDKSYCFLCAPTRQNARLEALCQTQDGFLIAQADLDQRGPGAFLGEEQHGRADVRLSMTLRDVRLLEEVMEAETTLTQQEPKALIALEQAAQALYAQPLEHIVLN